jgi:DNA-binding transcriptional MocR family regulator
MENSPWLRLNFVVQAPAEIEEGMKRLGKAIKRSGASSK